MPVDAFELGKSVGQAVAAARSGTMSYHGVVGSEAVEGTTQFEINGGAVRSTGSFITTGPSLEVVVDRDVVYLKGPPGPLSKGKPWVKIGPSPTDPAVRGLALIGRMVGNPLAQLSTAGRDAELVRNTGTLREYTLSGGSSDMVSVTLDAENRPTQIVTSEGISYFSKWGAPVTVTVPAATDVTTLR